MMLAVIALNLKPHENTVVSFLLIIIIILLHSHDNDDDADVDDDDDEEEDLDDKIVILGQL